MNPHAEKIIVAGEKMILASEDCQTAANEINALELRAQNAERLLAESHRRIEQLIYERNKAVATLTAISEWGGKSEIGDGFWCGNKAQQALDALSKPQSLPPTT